MFQLRVQSRQRIIPEGQQTELKLIERWIQSKWQCSQREDRTAPAGYVPIRRSITSLMAAVGISPAAQDHNQETPTLLS
jgi:hypothetical protein